jgi:hypothetical protein
MKRTVLATLGVVGACAACCAIPLAIPLMAGLSVTGLAVLEAAYFNTGIGLVVAVAVVAGIGAWLVRRRKRACLADAEGAACRTEGAAKGCGC